MRKFLPAWFHRPKPAPTPQPVAPYRFGWTLEHFRSQPSRIDDARAFLRSTIGQAMMSVLQHEIPLDSIDAVRGHRRAMRLLELMAEDPTKPSDQIEATFGAEKEINLQDEETNQPGDNT